MAAVNIGSDFGAQENQICHRFYFFLFYLSGSEGTGCHDSFFFFLIFSFKLAFTFSSFTLIKRFFSSSSLSAIRVVSPAYLRLLIFSPAILILACDSSSLAFYMMRCTCKLNKQGDNKQLYHMAFSILSQSIVTDRVLTWSTHSFLRRQIRWFGIPISKSFPQFIMIHTVKGVD